MSISYTRNSKMRHLGVTIYLFCLMVSLVKGAELKLYCYDPPKLGCAEQHILDCDEGQVITTDIAGFYVSFLKNKNYPECQTENNECKNKTTCCNYINDSVTVLGIKLIADNITPVINFIKTECSSKSSCLVSSYYNTDGGPNLYDYVTYNYGCIPAVKDTITVNIMINESTKFTGNSNPTVYYLDYTGNGTKNNDVILNRECIITTTERDITLTIKTLNLQADDCCRFHISGHNVSEYCSQSGSFKPPKGKYIGKNTASIRLENVVNKDGDSFSILVKAAGNVTVDCREIEHVDTQEPTTCQYPTPESSTISSSSTVVSSTKTLGTSPPKIAEMKMEDSETNLAGIIGGSVGGLVVLVVIIIVVIVIMRRRRRPKNKVDENDYYSTVDDNPKNKLEDNPKGSSNYSYIDIDLDKVGYKTVPKDIANPVKSSSGKDKDPKEVNKKNPIFEGKFRNNKESKDDKKRSVPKERVNAERKVETEAANYTYIDDSMIRPLDKPSVSAVKDSGLQNAKKESPSAQYTKVIKKQGKCIPTKDKAVDLDNYNHVGLKEGTPRIQEQDQDNYNHIDFNFKKDNSLPKGSNSKPSINNDYTDLPQKDEYKEQGGDRIFNNIGTKNENSVYSKAKTVPDTYNHIGTKNENYVYSKAKTVPDTYNHIGANNSMTKGDNSDLDTYNHIGVKNSVTKGDNSDLDTYNHIGVNNSVTKGDNSDLDTYNHIGVNNSVTKGDNSDLDTYNHIGVKNSVTKGDNSDLDTYNHIGVNNSMTKGDNSDLDTYNHIGVNNSMTKGDNSDLDTYNHIGVNNSVTKGDNSDLDTYNHIGVKNSVTKGDNSNVDTYNHI